MTSTNEAATAAAVVPISSATPWIDVTRAPVSS